MKQIKFRNLLLTAIGFMILSQCVFGKEEISDRSCSLWVITEKSTSDSFNYQIDQAARQFEATHKGIHVEVDILPTDAAEREIYLKQLRTQIMAGGGPDCYILPTGDTLIVDAKVEIGQVTTTSICIEPLFSDVVQTMNSGVFTDISSLYNADPDMEGLNEHVMDAGVIGSRRYVLPLRYTMPVVMSYTGVQGSITELVSQALEKEDILTAMGLNMPDDLSLLPRLYDYQKGEILVTEQEIAEYMSLYQQWFAVSQPAWDAYIGGLLDQMRTYLEGELPDYPWDVLEGITITRDSFNDVYCYGRYDCHWSQNGFQIYSDHLPGVLDQAAIGKVLGESLTAHPMKGMDGSVIAEVVYYGAIGAGCGDVSLAYDFIRLFLTEDYQWDQVRPRASRENYDIFNPTSEVQVNGMIEDSWPVRTAGATAYLWDTLQYQNYKDTYFYGENRHKALKSKNLQISDADLKITNCSIDEVRFPIYQPYEESFSYALSLLNDEDGTPTDVDIKALAEEVYRYLWWHLAEG